MPSTMPLNQSSDQPAVLVSSRPSSSSFCQKSVKVLTPLSSVRLTVTSEPSEESGTLGAGQPGHGVEEAGVAGVGGDVVVVAEGVNLLGGVVVLIPGLDLLGINAGLVEDFLVVEEAIGPESIGRP